MGAKDERLPPSAIEILAEHDVVRAALTTVMEQIPAAALVVTARGRVVHANAAARALLDGNDAARAALTAALRQQKEGRFALHRIESGEGGELFLAIDQAEVRVPAARLATIAERWGLTARQRDILAEVVLGRTNVAIADTLGIAPKTVEIHMTALLARAGASSRTELIAKFWCEA